MNKIQKKSIKKVYKFVKDNNPCQANECVKAAMRVLIKRAKRMMLKTNLPFSAELINQLSVYADKVAKRKYHNGLI